LFNIERTSLRLFFNDHFSLPPDSGCPIGSATGQAISEVVSLNLGGFPIDDWLNTMARPDGPFVVCSYGQRTVVSYRQSTGKYYSAVQDPLDGYDPQIEDLVHGECTTSPETETPSSSPGPSVEIPPPTNEMPSTTETPLPVPQTPPAVPMCDRTVIPSCRPRLSSLTSYQTG
jgi:hypothetical protein